MLIVINSDFGILFIFLLLDHVGADVVLRCVNFSSNATQTANKWGNYKCDTTNSTYLVALQAMKCLQPKPDFILYTGDSVPHWLDYTSVYNYSKGWSI